MAPKQNEVYNVTRQTSQCPDRPLRCVHRSLRGGDAVLIHVDFKNRRATSGPSTEATARPLYDNPMPREMDRTAYWERMIKCLEARFGETQPAHGVIYEQILQHNTFDAYGNGNAHDSIHQYRPSRGSKADAAWNKPMPFPANLPKIEEYLKANQGRVMRLGYKSDAFQWMEQRYGNTKSILEMAKENRIQLEIHTMSDLCGHDDFVQLIADGGHSIVFQMGFEETYFSEMNSEYGKSIEKMVSPGAPSIKRRLAAIEKLQAAGVTVTKRFRSLKDLNKAQAREFEKRTGSTVAYWMGEK